jgi:hypothetical protein
MRSAPRLAAGIICVALTTAAMAQQTPRRFEATARDHYFLEFRARGGGILGHTFVVYGRKDGAGRTVEEYHAGLNPDDAWGDSPVLAVALVQGEITFKREDPRKPVVAAYRRKLSAAEYAHLKLTVRRLKHVELRWHMWFYNCNDFAGQVAREMGLVTPLPWALPATFVNALRAINGP